MSWKGFFEGIQSISEDTLFAPYNILRSIQVDSWWAANIVSWFFISLGLIAFFYWMNQLKTFNDNGDEDKSITSHTFLGD